MQEQLDRADFVCAFFALFGWGEGSRRPQRLAEVGGKVYQVWRYTTISNLMINEQIRDKEVRLVGPDGAQLGIMSSREAMQRAQEAGLDLVVQFYDVSRITW